ncbi:MAG TPA: hypothetical protein VGN12_02745, partial [Pirellulales bacterium]
MELGANAFDALTERTAAQADDLMTCGDRDTPDGKRRIEKARCGRRSKKNSHAILKFSFPERRGALTTAPRLPGVLGEAGSLNWLEKSPPAIMEHSPRELLYLAVGISHGAVLRATNRIRLIRTAIRRILTKSVGALWHQKLAVLPRRIACNLFRSSPPEAGAVLDRGHAKASAEHDPHSVRRSEAAIEGDGFQRPVAYLQHHSCHVNAGTLDELVRRDPGRLHEMSGQIPGAHADDTGKRVQAGKSPVSVFIDGAYIRAVPGYQSRHFEIAMGRVVTQGRPPRKFAGAPNIATGKH